MILAWYLIQQYRFPLYSCDYLKQISIKTDVATDEGNSQNETGHWTDDEIGVAVQSWLWVLV